jgi:hypothetical protein
VVALEAREAVREHATAQEALERVVHERDFRQR